MAHDHVPKYHYKIAVFGGGAVGKSSLTTRLITGRFSSEYDPTLEDEYRKDVIIDGEDMRLDILDTAGREEFSPIQDEWIRTSDGFLIVYSITSHQAFEEIVVIRHKLLRARDVEDSKQIPIVVAGNKCDLDSERQVKQQEGLQFAKEHDIPFFETSAKEGINSDECFYQVAREIRRIESMTANQTQKKQKKQNNYCHIL